MITVVASMAAAVFYYFYYIESLVDLNIAYSFALLAMGYRNHTLNDWRKFAVADTRIIF